MIRLSASLALLVGSLLAVFETWVNWGQWQWWPWFVVDYVAAALLIGGGWLAFKRHPSGARLLSAGWAFAIGMAWMSLAGNVEAGPDPARDGRVAGFYLILIGLMIATSIAGLAMALVAKK
jgi:hypothetical protein